MKAMVYTRYGSPDVLELKEVKKPFPGDNQVLVKVHASSVNAFDWHVLRGRPAFLRLMGFGIRRPKYQILGADIAGQVEAIGKNVKWFKPGDYVFGDVSGSGIGGFAEYVCAGQNALAAKPENMTFEQAAALPLAAVTALQGLRDKGRIKSGQKVVINGASGGVGTFAVQIAKAFEAEVTGVCSTGKMDMVRELGADHVIDYTKEDFTRNGRQYDLIYAVNGYNSILAYKRALNNNGTYVLAGGEMAQMYQAMLLRPLFTLGGNKKVVNYVAQPNQKDLEFIAALFEEGKVNPVIDRRYPLSEVPDAIRHLEEGHARGKTVILIAEN
jgi:NADPH:quinone reductase-like Zn-dependent oxidoreductase